MRGGVRFAGAVAFVGMAAATFAGCGSPPASSGLEMVDGGRQVTVPVLWADTAQGVGGVEPAVVWVGDERDTDFSIDLGDLEAEGAGAAWMAASATAAAVGTLYSGRDPREVDVWFTVSGPIDGPSAGALLTVAILAALRDTPLLPGMTMTGMTSPDGTISAVGGVGLKLGSAAQAGYTTVLLPPGNATLTVSGSQRPISAVEAGRQLGLDVRHVATIAEAYEQLTGQQFVAEAREPYVLPDAVRAAASQTAEDLLSEATELAKRMPSDAPAHEQVGNDLAAARMDLAAEDAASAYARTTQALFAAGRAVTIDQYRTSFTEEGLDVTRAILADDVAAAITDAESALLQGSDVSGLGAEQALSLPAALTWSAYAQAELRALAAALPGVDDEEALLAAAAVLNEARISVASLQPDAIELVRAMPTRSLPSDAALAEYLSGYTNFLVRAAQANAQYISDVVLDAVPSASNGLDDVRSLAPVLAELARQTESFDLGVTSSLREVGEASVAMTDFVSTAAFIASTQGFGVEGFNMVAEAPAVTDEVAVRASFETSRGIVADVASLVAAQGRDAGYAVWSAEWGSAAFEDLARENRLASGAVLAFNELWYDVINLQMIQASTAVLDSGAAAGEF